MREPGRLVVYVTSHGFGHLNRAVSVVNLLPAEIPVTIRADANLFGHWKERLERPAALEAYSSDVGAVSPPGDSVATDGAATLAKARAKHEEAVSRLDEEVARLQEMGAAAVLSDIPPLPLVAAKRAGVPALAMGNFTWSEIYEEHAEVGGNESREFVQELRKCYAQADLLFRLSPGLEMAEFGEKRRDVGMVVTPGRSRREELRERLGIRPTDQLAYFYIGRYGQETLDWKQLRAFEGVQFVGFHPAPFGPLPNLHVVDPREWNGTDLMASVDVAVIKAGYMSVCEAMVSGTPVIYPPREGFAEYRPLHDGLQQWGGGLLATAEQFERLELAELLERASKLKAGPPPFPVDGAKRVAEYVEQLCRQGVA